MFSWLIAASLAVSPPVAAPIAAPVAAIESAPAPREQVVALPPALRARLHAEVLQGKASQLERLRRLVDFIVLPTGLGLVYEEDATYTIEQAYATRRGNCVTFTLLFLALARETGLRAWPQESEETLAWHLRDNTLYRSNHVNAGVQVGGRTYRVDAAPIAVITLHPPARISEQRLLAHYYNNHAIAAMDQRQLPLALRYMAIAIDLDPDYANTWSNAGVVALRNGDIVAAERNYTNALALDPRNAGALFNMSGLLQRTGDARREAGFRKRLEQVQRRDPFHHFLLAVDYERSGDYANAIRHYRRAIRLYPSEYRFHVALATAYLQVGDTRRAHNSFARAHVLGGDTIDDAAPAARGLPQPALGPPPGQ